MRIPTESFLGSLEKWLTAVRNNDLPAAKSHAEFMQKHGELLIINPEFRRSFLEHCSDVEPREALKQMTQFVTCATEVTARAMREAGRKRSSDDER
jgi:hypothetical protein